MINMLFVSSYGQCLKQNPSKVYIFIFYVTEMYIQNLSKISHYEVYENAGRAICIGFTIVSMGFTYVVHCYRYEHPITAITFYLLNRSFNSFGTRLTTFILQRQFRLLCC